MSTAEQISTLIQTMVAEAVTAQLAPPRPAERLYSTKRAAKYLSLSTRTVQNMVANGELRQVSAGRRVLIDVEDLDRWIENAKRQQQ